MLKKLLQVKGLHIAGITFIGLIALGFISQYFYRLYSLVSNNYVIQLDDIYEIGDFKMQGRAYEYGASKNSSPRFEFRSRNGFSFTIDHSIFRAIVDKPKLKDTLMHHECQFKIFADKETYEKYKKSSKPFHINVLQIQFGNKKYIDINKANQIEKRRLIWNAATGLILILFVTPALVRLSTNHNKTKTLFTFKKAIREDTNRGV